MAKYNRDTLLSELRSDVIEVTFVKADGTKRAIRCTLRADLLPESYKLAPDEYFHKSNSDLLAVWDLQDGAWKSFHVESIEYAQSVQTW